MNGWLPLLAASLGLSARLGRIVTDYWERVGLLAFFSDSKTMDEGRGTTDNRGSMRNDEGTYSLLFGFMR